MNQEIRYTDEQLNEYIKELEHLTFSIKALELEKCETEELLQLHFNHHMDGAKTYTAGNYKVTLTTGLNHRLNKEKYQEYKDRIKPEFDPVTEVIDYHLNKKLIRDCIANGTKEDRLLQSEFITSTEKKLNVTYKEVK